MNWSDGDMIDDASWDEAVAREIVIRRLVSGKPINRAAFYQACSELGIKRTRLYGLQGAASNQFAGLTPCGHQARHQ